MTALRLASKALCKRRHEDDEGIADRAARHAQHEAQRHQHPGHEPAHRLHPSHRRRGFVSRKAPAGFAPRRNSVDDTLIIAPRLQRPAAVGQWRLCRRRDGRAASPRFGGDGTVEITLRAPIPIDRALQVVREGEALMLRDGDTLICEARAGSVAHLAPPPPPDRLGRRDAPRRGRRQPAGHRFHLVHRLRPRAARSATACACWARRDRSRAIRSPAICRTPTMPTREGRIRPEFVWGTLDCPGRLRRAGSSTTCAPPSPAA